MTWFSRLRNWQTDQSNGIGIRADNHDSEDNNFATGINSALNIAGLNSPSADISWATNKITNLKAATAASDACTLSQAQTRVSAYAADSVGTDSYAITVSPAITAYAVGQQFTFAPGTSNTGACSLNVSGLGAKPIKKDYNVDPSDGDLSQNQMISVVYDGTNFQMVNAAKGLVSQNLSQIYAADGGGSDSYVITLTPAITSYSTGQLINFKANTKNTGAASLNVNGLGAKTIKKDQGADLANSDIEANQIVQVIYDGTNFQMLSPIFGSVGQNGGSIYAADAGASDTYAITLAPAPTAYTTGMVVRFKANTLNTGAATLNCNSLGAITLKKFGTTNDLATGDILANQIVEVIYDGTNFQMISCVDDIINLTNDATPDYTADYIKTWDASATTYKRALLSAAIPAATQANQETSTSNIVFVTPGVQQYHPSASKAWVQFTGVTTTAINISYNITSLTDNGTGDTSITIATDFSSASYPVSGSAGHTDGVRYVLAMHSTTNPTVTLVRVLTVVLATLASQDTAFNSVMMFGDQA